LKSILLPALAVVLLPWSVTLAQVPPGPGDVQRAIQDVRRFYRLEQRLADPDTGPADVVEAPDAPPKATPPADADQQVYVGRIQVDASALLDPADIQAAVAPVEGRMVTLGELFAAVERINALYAARRCVTCRAFLPAQDVQDGAVRIQLVEARVGEVRVEPGRFTRPGFFTDRVGLGSGDLFRLEQLEGDLVRLNGTGLVRARSRLAPGREFGTVDVVIEPLEPPRWQGVVFADNAGRDTVGEYRLGATVVNNGVFGRSDPLTLTVTAAEGTLGGTVGYELPVNRYGTRVALLYDYSDIEVQEGPFADLDVGGSAWTAGLTVTHPLRVTAGSRLQAFVGGFAKQADTEFGSQTLVSTEVRAITYGLEYLLVGDFGVLFTSHSFTNGDERDADDGSYFKYNADFSWQKPFASGWATVLRVSGQWADRDLLPSQEQYQLGGISTVRGYEQGLLIGDSGYFISGEVQAPIRALDGTDWAALRLVAFLDHGGAFPFRPGGASNTSDDYLTSAGVGVNFGWRQRLSGRAQVGVPFNDPFENQNSAFLHLYLQANF
jgi:hemolysin activation/secretion protein